MSAAALNCIEDLVGKVSSVAGLENRVFHVYSEEELVERTKGLSFPCVGVVYDGLMGQPSQKGESASIVVTVMLFVRQNTRAATDPKSTTVGTLDEIRGKILQTRAPSGHFWKFQLEAPVEGKNGLLAYVQRWATPVQLTS